MLSFGANLYPKMTFGSFMKSCRETGEAESLAKLGSEARQTRVVAPLKAQSARVHQTADRRLTIAARPTRADDEEGDRFGPTDAACAGGAGPGLSAAGDRRGSLHYVLWHW